jgi:hypothetical protein
MVELLDRDAERIKTSCRTWRGDKIPKSLKKIIKEYGFNVSINGNNHYEFELGGRKIYYSGSSSDWRAGRNFGKKLVDFIRSG